MTRTAGRPRSEEARLAVLHAADDLLVEGGYAKLTMKGIAERAGVGRQTVYRWWQSKAEILLEASRSDAENELRTEPQATPHDDVVVFLTALVTFLTVSDAGLAYRALLGEAQHDKDVADLLRSVDVLGDAAATVLNRLRDRGEFHRTVDGQVTAELVGPVVYRVLAHDWRGEPDTIAASASAFLRY
ncbi:MAG: TetR/AcrR family transcriptional regulator [Gordonia sp. (in: high G+C Gram-positive bacteria)]|jgi:AcrR family transcriptional regulator|nr:TetR/AcrR family transcriptional regulator [Gordonia sp. (in: high G+C Gram-positive bacteria)]